MVKLTFNSSLVQKEPRKECTAEVLIPTETVPVAFEQDVKEVRYAHGYRGRQQSRLWCWCMCLVLGLILSCMVVGGAYFYRFILQEEEGVFFCGVDYRMEDYMVRDVEGEEEDEGPGAALRHIQESIRVLEEEAVEFIDVPEYDGGDSATIVHDFNKRLTAYLDLTVSKCYIIPLNTSVVLPPKEFQELLINIQARSSPTQSYLVHEEMIVTEQLEEVEDLGSHIHGLCQSYDTYMMERRATVLGIQKREAPNCNKIRHFENFFVVETLICEP